jgi:hypothetical protein
MLIIILSLVFCISTLSLFLQEEKDENEEGGKPSLTVWDAHAAGGSGDYGPYGDAESKAFYEDLPDLLAQVPLTALGLTPEQVLNSAATVLACVGCITF